jgi:hypothetical protein
MDNDVKKPVGELAKTAPKLNEPVSENNVDGYTDEDSNSDEFNFDDLDFLDEEEKDTEE